MADAAYGARGVGLSGDDGVTDAVRSASGAWTRTAVATFLWSRIIQRTVTFAPGSSLSPETRVAAVVVIRISLPFESRTVRECPGPSTEATVPERECAWLREAGGSAAPAAAAKRNDAPIPTAALHESRSIGPSLRGAA